MNHRNKRIYGSLISWTLICLLLFIGLLGILFLTGFLEMPITSPDPIDVGWPVWNQTEQTYSGTFLADGRTIAIGNAFHGTIYYVDATNARFLGAAAVSSGHIDGLAATSDGRQLLCVTDDILFLDQQDPGKLLGRLSVGGQRFNPCLAVSPDSKTAAVTSVRMSSPNRLSGGGFVLLVDVENRRVTKTLETSGVGGGVAFSPDGQRLAVMTAEQTYLWDLTEGTTLLAGIPHATPGTLKIQFSNDSQRLGVFYPGGYLTGSPQQDTWIIYNARNGEFVRKAQADDATAPGDPLPVFCDQFRSHYLPLDLTSPDGTRRVYGGGYEINITNPLLPNTPTVQYLFFPDSPTETASVKAANWYRFIRVPYSTYRAYVYWDGSSGSGQFIQWNLGRTGLPGPTRAQIQHQRRPDIIDGYLNRVMTPASAPAAR